MLARSEGGRVSKLVLNRTRPLQLFDCALINICCLYDGYTRFKGEILEGDGEYIKDIVLA